ncbi:MAG: carboxypeptidase-like regulatory domain-containing protein, partial [Planctomycetota bacterium]
LDGACLVEGRVIDSQGHPIAMARVTPGSSPGTTYGIAKFTDENGRFVAGHAPAGTLNVRASRSGFLLANQGNVVVRRGETTPIADIILETAPIIGGRVRDPNGAPIAGVVVGGWPKIDGAGRYARAISDAEGRFEIALPQMAPFAIGAKKRGYQTWGDEEDRTRTTEPGTLDLEITLVPVEPIVLRVVDAESGLPVELFGCHLLGDQGEDGLLPLSVPAEAAPLRPRPDGEISVPGREGLDAYAIYIEGMSPFTGTLYRDRVEAPHMEIRVSAQPSLQGQLVRSGSPIAGATVSAIPGTKQQPYYAAGPTGETANERAERLVMLRERSLRRFKPDQLQEVRGTTDENGFFTLEGLKPTAHSLRFTDENAVSTRVYPIDLSDGSVDLGAVEFTGPGAIQGQLLVPAGMDPSGLKVELMSMDRRRYATSDSAGRFEFADVDQGLHELLCQGRAGDLARSSPVPVEVPGGGTGTVDLDLLGSALTPIQLTLRMDGEPVAGASVFARNTESPDAFSPQLGDSDENGVVSGFVSGSGTLQLGMQLNGVMLPKESLPPITYQHGFPVDEMIDVRVAELSITLPPDVHIPNEGELHLTLHTEGSLLGVTTVKTQVSGGAPTGYGSSAVTIEGQTITFGLLPQLAVRASLDVTSSDGGERTLRPLPGLTIETPRWPSVFEAVFEVDGSTGAFAPVILTR